MESQISSVSAASSLSHGKGPTETPVQTGQSAMTHDPQPDIPLPIPASMGSVGAVNQSRLNTTENGVSPVKRTLKPYGVNMLPHTPSASTNRPGERPDHDPDQKPANK